MKLKWILRESKTDQAGQDANDRSGGKWCFLQICFFFFEDCKFVESLSGSAP